MSELREENFALVPFLGADELPPMPRLRHEVEDGLWRILNLTGPMPTTCFYALTKEEIRAKAGAMRLKNLLIRAEKATVERVG